MHDHEWPSDPTEHVWGQWLTKDRTTKYRVCVHPVCIAHEEKEVKG